MDNVLREKVFFALGEASMCWSETPKGVFDDQRATQIGEELLEAIDASLRRRDELPRNSVHPIPWGEPHDG